MADQALEQRIIQRDTPDALPDTDPLDFEGVAGFLFFLAVDQMRRFLASREARAAEFDAKFEKAWGGMLDREAAELAVMTKPLVLTIPTPRARRLRPVPPRAFWPGDLVDTDPVARICRRNGWRERAHDARSYWAARTGR
jgi:hypothetical protein